MGNALLRRGFQKGDILCIISPNCCQYPMALHGVISIGGAVTTCNPQGTMGKFMFIDLPISFQAAEENLILNTVRSLILLESCLPFAFQKYVFPPSVRVFPYYSLFSLLCYTLMWLLPVDLFHYRSIITLLVVTIASKVARQQHVCICTNTRTFVY